MSNIPKLGIVGSVRRLDNTVRSQHLGLWFCEFGQMAKNYVVRNWIVKRGRDEDFVAAWKVFAMWMVSQKGAIGPTRLLKDNLDPAHYVSIDSWEDEAKRDLIHAGVQFGKQSYKLEQLTMDCSYRSFTLEAEDSR